jgi:hypothetical protein
MDENVMDMLDKMNEMIKDNNETLKRIEDKLDNQVTNECEKMGSHIDFVESVYERLRHPIDSICYLYSGNKYISSNEQLKTE